MDIVERMHAGCEPHVKILTLESRGKSFSRGILYEYSASATGLASKHTRHCGRDIGVRPLQIRTLVGKLSSEDHRASGLPGLYYFAEVA